MKEVTIRCRRGYYYYRVRVVREFIPRRWYAPESGDIDTPVFRSYIHKINESIKLTELHHLCDIYCCCRAHPLQI